MAFWTMIIGAAVYLLCNQITGKSTGVQSFINCAAILGLVAFGCGLLAFLLGAAK